MDIEYLLLLQNLREGICGGVFNWFAEFLSDLVLSPWPIIFTAIIYWTVDKRAGGFFFMNFATSKVVNEVVKLSVCCYRPWIRDPRVLPAGDSIKTATGYSFPSGHSNLAVSTYGSLALWQWLKNRWFSIIAIVLLFLTLFSRNFLGVHTPQDVIIGTLLSGIMLFVDFKIFKYFEKGSKKAQAIIMVTGITISILMLAYINYKPYPMDYIDGNLIVNPRKMLPDCYEAVGMLLGFLLGWFFERHVTNFQIPKEKSSVIVLACFAIIPIYFWQVQSGAWMTPFIDAAWTKLVTRVVEYFYILAIIPIFINLLTIKKVRNLPAK